MKLTFQPWRILGVFILRYRAAIGAILLVFTAILAYGASKVTISTRFEDFFPVYHQNVKLYEQYKRYGGAQTLIVLLRVKDGDIFNAETLQRIADIQGDLDALPGVNHYEIFSLASPRVAYPWGTPGNLGTKAFMSPLVPKTPDDIRQLKINVETHRADVRGLVTPDDKGAIFTASFSEDVLPYGELFQEVQGLVHKYQGGNYEVYLAGEPIIRGYGYHYLRVIALLLAVSILVIGLVLYFSLHNRARWWVPAVTGTLSATWGLGFSGLMGYYFDPVMLVVPLLLTARDLSHGIQWQCRYYDELDRFEGDRSAACLATTEAMMPPGLLSILADIAGIIFISFGGIPVLQHLAYMGAIWLASSMLMVFVFQPILVSYLPVLKRELEGDKQKRNVWPQWVLNLGGWLSQLPVTPGVPRTALFVISAGVIILGVVTGVRAHVGYTTVGTPLYKPSSKVNRDIQEVAKYFPLDEGWVILETPDYPQKGSVLDPETLRMADDLVYYLKATDPNVRADTSFATNIEKTLELEFHYSFPKFIAIPITANEAGGMWYMFDEGTAPGELDQYIQNGSKANNTIVRIFLRDHTYDTLNSITDRLNEFKKQRVDADPGLSSVKMLYLGGEAGLYKAANDILYKLDFLNLTCVLAIVFLFCWIVFESLVAACLFILSCILANFAAFIYMAVRGIGLTIDTIPVISLGIGLGVDYGIYTVSRIVDEVAAGKTIDEAIPFALKTTGVAVLNTFVVMIGAIALWSLSPLLFHSEMSVLLVFLMATNMIAGVLVLPAYISWRRPKFVSKQLTGEAEPGQRVSHG